MYCGLSLSFCRAVPFTLGLFLFLFLFSCIVWLVCICISFHLALCCGHWAAAYIGSFFPVNVCVARSVIVYVLFDKYMLSTMHHSHIIVIAATSVYAAAAAACLVLLLVFEFELAILYYFLYR